jgi:hypothetical protein
LALHHPNEYAEKLEAAHPAISAFGGAFLLVLAMEFFVDETRSVVWLRRFDRLLQRANTVWVPALFTLFVVLCIAALPANHHARTTVIAGTLGVVTHLAIELLTKLLGRTQPQKNNIKKLTGMAAFWAFIYLQILDASFSFDGVIGAFAITSSIILIAVGLGVGALWVRSLTVFLVRRGTLESYIYLEHGAHYTIAVLAFVLLLSNILNIPDTLPGVTGIGIIAAAVITSRQALTAKHRSAHR